MENLTVSVLENVDFQGRLTDGGEIWNLYM